MPKTVRLYKIVLNCTTDNLQFAFIHSNRVVYTVPLKVDLWICNYTLISFKNIYCYSILTFPSSVVGVPTFRIFVGRPLFRNGPCVGCPRLRTFRNNKNLLPSSSNVPHAAKCFALYFSFENLKNDFSCLEFSYNKF